MTYTTPKEGAPAKRRYGGVSGEERSRQRRAVFVEAALDVFGTLGYSKSTMRDICGKARLVERYFYENFTGLEDAFGVVYLQLNDALLHAITEAVMQATGGPMGRAAAGLRAFYQFIKDDPRRAQIMLIDSMQFDHSSPHNQQAMLNRFGEIMRAGAQATFAPLPASVNPELVATGLVGMAVQTCIAWVHSGFREPVDVVVEHNMYAWRGLLRWYSSLQSAPYSGDGSVPDRRSAAR